jgi:hypothetical protein
MLGMHSIEQYLTVIAAFDGCFVARLQEQKRCLWLLGRG